MRVVISGATGLIGRHLVAALRDRGDDVSVLARNPDRASERLGVRADMWDPVAVPPPAAALSGADAVVHLAGEPVSQRWNAQVRRRIHESRELGTRHLVHAIGALSQIERPDTLVCASASGYYGRCGAEALTEDAPPGGDFLAQVCVAWESEAAAVERQGVRRCSLRTGMVLARDGGALPKMLTPFRLGFGGPVAGGKQYVPWIHVDDVVALYLRAIDDGAWAGAYNASAPEPVTNAEFSRALGRTLGRPAIVPVPGIALRTIFGGMAELVTAGQRQVPQRALDAGFEFAHPTVDDVLADLLG